MSNLRLPLACLASALFYLGASYGHRSALEYELNILHLSTTPVTQLGPLFEGKPEQMATEMQQRLEMGKSLQNTALSARYLATYMMIGSFGLTFIAAIVEIFTGGTKKNE